MRGAEGSAPPTPPAAPGRSCWVPSCPAPAPQGDTEPGAKGAPTSLGDQRMRQGPGGDPTAAEQSTSTGQRGPPANAPLPRARALCTHGPPREQSRGVEQEGDTYILSDDCKSKPEAILQPLPLAAPRWGAGGLWGRCLQKRKAEAGPLKKEHTGKPCDKSAAVYTRA